MPAPVNVNPFFTDITRQDQAVYPMLVYSWVSVADTEPTEEPTSSDKLPDSITHKNSFSSGF